MLNNHFKVGIYLRLSREDDNLLESASISTQRDILLKYINDNNLEFVKEYVDDGVSGTTFNRVGFNQMINDCKNKIINMIITKDTSRLGRDHIEFGYYVEKFFPENSIRYVAVNDGIDTFSESSNNDMLLFKSAFNDMYVKDISNKLKSSLNIKKRNGLFVGPSAPYGYKKDIKDKHKLIIDDDSALIVKQIYSMFINGKSISNICEILTKEGIKTPSIQKNMTIGHNNYHYGIWSNTTVSDILKNPTYIGNLAQCKQKKVSYKSKKIIHNRFDDWIICENCVPSIIDKDIFFIVQKMFNSNKNRTSINDITSNLLLRGLIYCKECSHTIGFRVQKQFTKKYGEVIRIYGNCNYYLKRKKLNVCTAHNMRYEEIERIVLNNLKKIIFKNISLEMIDKIINESIKNNFNIDFINSEITILNNRINNINNKKIDCYNDKLEGLINKDMYKNIINSFNEEIILLNNKIVNHKLYLENIKNNSLYNNYYNKFISIINFTIECRSFIVTLINKIEIDEDNNIFIFYNF